MVSNLVRITRTFALALVAFGVVATASPLLAFEAAPAIIAATPLVTQRVDNARRVTLPGNVNPLARAANDHGAADASLQAPRLQLLLKRPADREAALKQYIADIHNKNSASYHKWLKPEQIAQKYGLADSDVQAVVGWMQSQGFTVSKISRARSVIEFAGTTGQVNAAFSTSIHKYSVNGATHFANSSNPQIPAALAPVVRGIVRMNDFHPRSQAKVLGTAQYSPKTHQAKPSWNYPENGGAIYLVDPSDFAVQYNTNPLLSSGTKGAGVTIGIIGDSNIDLTEVNAFRSLFSLPVNTPSVIVDGTDPGINGDAVEAYLDVEWSGAVAPAANVNLYIAADTTLNAGLDLAVTRAVDDDIAQVVSLSFGECEQQLGSTELAFYNNIWEQAAAQGQTVSVSTGDSGAEGCYNSQATTLTYGLAVNGFASTPYNVAVGGTDFYYSDYASSGSTGLPPSFSNYWSDPNSTSTTPATTITRTIPEQPWNNTAYGFNIAAYGPGSSPASLYADSTPVGGSGGISACADQTDATDGSVTCNGGYAKPAFQSQSTPADSVRDLPDVSLFAANGYNYSATPICGQAGDCNTDGQSAAAGNGVIVTALGGTSVAAPSFAGVMALIDQYTQSAQGQADYVLYPLFKQFPSSFNDVTHGSNDEPCDPTAQTTTACVTGTINNYVFTDSSAGGYSAATGYDLASGLGTLNVANLAANWNNITFTGTSTSLGLSSATITHGTTETLTATVTGATSGDVSFVNTAALPGSNGTFLQPVNSSGIAALTTNALPGGTYTITAQYAGTSTISPSSSAPQTVTVNPEPANINLAAFATGVSNNQESTVAITSAATYPYGTQVSADIQPVGTSVTQAAGSAPGSLATDGIATGSATFTDTSAGSATVSLNSAGIAEWSTGTFGIGTHSITAKYSGDASFNAAASAAPVTFTITQGTPQVDVEPILTSQQNGSSLSVQVVLFYTGAGAAPTGSVQVSVGGQTQSGTLVPFYAGGNYSATTVTFPSIASSTAITAVYAGDTNWKSATASVTFQSGPGTSLVSTTALSVAPVTANNATSFTLKAVVSGTATGPAPTGSVYFFSNSTQISPAVPLPAGNTGTPVTASFTVSGGNLYGASNQFIAVYGGDSSYAPSTSPATIGAVDQSDFTLASQTQLVSIANGGTGSATVNLGSVNGFNNTVNLSCASPQTNITCSIAPGSVTVNGAATAAVTIKVAGEVSKTDTRPVWYLGGSAALACVLLIGIPARRRGWRSMLGLLLFVTVMATNGCGGGGKSSGGGGETTTVATPTFSPAAGTFSSAQSVTIADTTPGATIYYTTNGATPTTSSTRYTGAISVASTQTISAIATASGDTTSAVATAKYTISATTVPPATTGSNPTIHNVTIQVVTPAGSGTVVVTGSVGS